MAGEYNDSMVQELGAFFLPRDGWITWTPTVTQGAAITVTVTYARYIILARTVLVRARLALTSAGTPGNDIIIGGAPSVIYPANVGNFEYIIGGGIYLDFGTAIYTPALVAVGNADWRLVAPGAGVYFGTTPAVTVANGDALGIFAAYERA